MGILAYLAPRYLKTPWGVSEPVYPAHSLGAGCFQANQLARVVLYAALDRVHSGYFPVQLSTTVWSYVDDLSQRKE